VRRESRLLYVHKTFDMYKMDETKSTISSQYTDAHDLLPREWILIQVECQAQTGISFILSIDPALFRPSKTSVPRSDTEPESNANPCPARVKIIPLLTRVMLGILSNNPSHVAMSRPFPYNPCHFG